MLAAGQGGFEDLIYRGDRHLDGGADAINGLGNSEDTGFVVVMIAEVDIFVEALGTE